MGNKLTPRKVVVGAAGLTLLNSILKRSQMLVLNKGAADLGLTSDAAETAFADCYPVGPDGEFTDISKGSIYGISSSGNLDVWVWETEH